jgi:hypothetical protein
LDVVVVVVVVDATGKYRGSPNCAQKQKRKDTRREARATYANAIKVVRQHVDVAVLVAIQRRQRVAAHRHNVAGGVRSTRQQRGRGAMPATRGGKVVGGGADELVVLVVGRALSPPPR